MQGAGTRVTASARYLGNTAPGKAAQPHDPDHRPQLAANTIDLRSELPYVSGERRSLLAWANVQNVLIIENDYDSEFAM